MYRCTGVSSKSFILRIVEEVPKINLRHQKFSLHLPIIFLMKFSIQIIFDFYLKSFTYPICWFFLAKKSFNKSGFSDKSGGSNRRIKPPNSHPFWPFLVSWICDYEGTWRNISFNFFNRWANSFFIMFRKFRKLEWYNENKLFFGDFFRFQTV